MKAAPKDRTIDTHAKHMQMLKTGLFNGSTLFLGDSMMERWTWIGKDLWHTHLKPLKVFNGGVGGDRICNLLWRIENGILDYPFSRVILMIGTNDLQKTQPQAIVNGIVQVIEEIQKRNLPLLVYGLTPRTDISEEKILKVNNLLEKTCKELKVDYHCFYPKEDCYYDDNVHLSHLGYEEWLKELLSVMK